MLGSSGSISNTPSITVGSGATLDVSALAASFIVLTNHTLNGNGTVAGSLAVNGTIAPGASVGTLTTGPETWNGGGSYLWEISTATNASTAGAAGLDWDLVNLTGNLTIASTNTNTFNIIITNCSALSNPTNFDATKTYSWKIAEVTDSGSSVMNFNASKFLVSSNNFSLTPGAGAFSVVLSNKAVCVVYAPTGSPCEYATTRANYLERLTGPDRTNMVMVLSNYSGLVSVQAIKTINCAITGMVYSTSGYLGDVASVTTDAKTTLPPNSAMVLLKAVKGTEDVGAAVNVIAIDKCGRGLSFDPVFTTLRVTTGGQVQQRFDGLLPAERYLRVINGSPGLKWLEVNLNGRVFRLELADNQEVAADLASAMREGESNVVVLTGGGEAGASAVVTISETPGGILISLPEVVRLAMRQTRTGLEFSWADTLSGWALQSSTDPEAGWTGVSAVPVAVDGQLAVAVPVTEGGRFYRLAGPASETGSLAAPTNLRASGCSPSTTPSQVTSFPTHEGILW